MAPGLRKSGTPRSESNPADETMVLKSVNLAGMMVLKSVDEAGMTVQNSVCGGG